MAMASSFLILMMLVVFLVTAIVAGSRYGIEAVLKAVLTIFGVLILASVPLLFMARVQTSRGFNTHRSFNTPQAPQTPVFMPGLTVTEPASLEISVADSIPSASGSSSAAGVRIGQSETWSEKFESEHMADLYSSSVEAAKAIARRCGAMLQKHTHVHPQELLVHFRLDENSFHLDDRADVELAFKEELRLSAPELKLTSTEQADCIQLVLHKDVQISGVGVRTFHLPLFFDGDQFDLTARYVSKHWVKNDVQFRMSSKAPRNYIVALGDTSPDGRPAIDVAAERLEDEVSHFLTNSNFGYSSGEFPSLARVAAISLTKDKFTQTFSTTMDGSRVDRPITREAILIDTTRSYLRDAIVAAKTGNTYTLPYERQIDNSLRFATNQRRQRQSSGPQGYGRLAAVLLACCGAAKGISWLFDRKTVDE